MSNHDYDGCHDQGLFLPGLYWYRRTCRLVISFIFPSGTRCHLGGKANE